MATEGIPPPVLLALVVCDEIWIDPATYKRFFLGCFPYLGSEEFPAEFPSFRVHVALTNGRDRATIRVQVVDVNEKLPPVKVEQDETNFEDPRYINELDFDLSGITFPAPGEYRVQIFSNGSFVGERKILVMESS